MLPEFGNPLRTSSGTRSLSTICRHPNPLHLGLELQHFPETSIPRMNPAAGMQNLAVLRVHKFRSFDPFSMNVRAMNRSRHHRCCTHAQPQFCDFWIYFLIDCSDVLAAASWDQAVSHRRHPCCACFRIQFELSILNILTVNRALTVWS